MTGMKTLWFVTILGSLLAGGCALDDRSQTGSLVLRFEAYVEDAAIIGFLHTLTDHQFMDDPKFGSPFE